ncbi:hypothetical protein I3843_01G232300 [Carya illinoinensis]|nr:hypothetical protein I3843_01G232300 [Carya illinoinensis]
MTELVSVLPDDIVRDCLARVSYEGFPTIASVCKDWMAEIQLPEFHRLRKDAGHAQKLIVMAQARVEPNLMTSGVIKCSVHHPVHRLTICEPETGVWRELPLAPEMSAGLPMFCRLAGTGSYLVVMGGWDPVTWTVSNSVFVYNFLTATWRRGADMPGRPRTFFGCASDSERRMVYVAGGHDENKVALRSAMAYDVDEDEWVMLPDMARDRDECKAIFHAGKFRIIGGYCTEMQGRFERTAEEFDVSTWCWNHIEEDFLEAGKCPRTCAGGDDGAVYMCRGADVVANKSAKWQVVGKLPAEVCNVAYTWMWQGKFLVIGSTGFGRSHVGYILDLKCYSWTKVQTPENYSGHVQAGCYFEI